MMTEKEKMLSGEWYDAMDTQLLSELTRAKRLCQQYNAIAIDHEAERMAVLRQLLGRVGEFALIQPNFFCDYGYNISLGERFFANHNCVILDCARVSFGDNVLLGPNCQFYTVNHPLAVHERQQWLERALPISVGNNVWIGGNSTVLPGVTIGDNSVVAAGSVVTKDVPANCVVAGNPARVVKDLSAVNGSVD